MCQMERGGAILRIRNFITLNIISAYMSENPEYRFGESWQPVYHVDCPDCGSGAVTSNGDVYVCSDCEWEKSRDEY